MPTQQNGQTRSDNSLAQADFECVWPFCGVGAQRVKMTIKLVESYSITCSTKILTLAVSTTLFDILCEFTMLADV